MKSGKILRRPKIILILLLVGLAAFVFEANIPDHKKETPFLNLLRSESVIHYIPENTVLVSSSEHDGMKEKLQIAPEGAYISNITNVFQVKQNATVDLVIDSIAKRASKDGWTPITCPSGNIQCEGSLGDKIAFSKMIGNNKTQLWILKTDRTTDSVTVYAEALNVINY